MFTEMSGFLSGDQNITPSIGPKEWLSTKIEKFAAKTKISQISRLILSKNVIDKNVFLEY